MDEVFTIEKNCYIFGAGDYGAMALTACQVADGYCIAADGGYAYLQRWGIVPQLVVGDFDSLPAVPQFQPLIRHPVRKNDTDMLLAVKEGFRAGCSRFFLYGGLGGRLDHTLANLQVLVFIAQRGGTGFLIGEDTTVTALHSGTLRFPQGYTGTLSVFCSGDRAQGVCLEGLQYPLHQAVLTHDMPLGVSNGFTAQPAVVTVEDGTLIVLWLGNAGMAQPEYEAAVPGNSEPGAGA